MRYSNRPLFWQLLLPMLLVTALWAASATLAVVGLQESRGLLHGLYTNNVGVVFRLERLGDRFSGLNLLLLQHLASEKASEMEALNRGIEALRDDTYDQLDTVESAFLAAHPDRRDDFLAVRQSFDAFMGSAGKIILLSADFEKEAAFAEFHKNTQQGWLALQSGLSGLSRLEAGTMEKAYQRSLELEQHNTGVTIGASLATGLLSLVILFWVARHTARRMEKVAACADALGGGDLSARAEDTSKDEIGRLGLGLGQMAVRLKRSMAELEHSHLALREAHDDLELRVAERTSELRGEIESRRRTERDLLRAKEQAELASKAKSEFLANMSHELRTPLNAIIGFADMVRQEIFGPIDQPKYLDYVNDIHKSGNHLLGLIGEILDMSKIEAGKYTLHPEDLALTDIIEESLMMVRSRADRAGLALEVEVPADLPRVTADGQATKQVLLNLLTNAVKFTPEGGSVAIRASHSNGDLMVAVSDTGVGMAPDDLLRALQPFVQIEREKGRSHEGTGLGLPLSKKLIEMQGGTLGLESTAGKGTTATFTLPVSGL